MVLEWTAQISRRAAERIRAGHLWVYRSDVERLPAEVPGGALVRVQDGRGTPLGSALHSSGSEITLRLVSPRADLDREQYVSDVRSRLHAAIRLREQLAPEAFAADSGDNACRIAFSEADGLPGIIADRYNGLVVVQLLIQGTAQDDVRRVIAEILAEQSWADMVIERPDTKVRELENIRPATDAALFSREGKEPSPQTVFTINGVQFQFDAAAGQKTGAFLDQRLNYAAAARVARGRALDVCTYHGGFALHLASGQCERVTGVDASRAALEVADSNLERNAARGKIRASVDWMEADAFELLRDLSDRGERFDTVVLDPPAFAKTKRAAEGAMRGYKELNLRALKMLTGGGTLVTCSCSHHVHLEDFLAMLRTAAANAGRRVQLLETRGAAPDHPAILTLPETTYLKCLICRVS